MFLIVGLRYWAMHGSPGGSVPTVHVDTYTGQQMLHSPSIPALSTVAYNGPLSLELETRVAVRLNIKLELPLVVYAGC